MTYIFHAKWLATDARGAEDDAKRCNPLLFARQTWGVVHRLAVPSANLPFCGVSIFEGGTHPLIRAILIASTLFGLAGLTLIGASLLVLSSYCYHTYPFILTGALAYGLVKIMDR